MSKPSVIAVGYGTHFFAPDNVERARLAACSRETAALHQIIFTRRSDAFTEEKLGSTFVLHPTNSRYKVCMVYDAVQIARRLIKSSNQPYIVTTQDPFATGVVGIVLQKLYGVRLVVQEHGDVFGTAHWRRESFFNQISYQIGTFILRQADAVRVVASRVAQHVAAVGVDPRKIVSLPVAIDTKAFTAKQHDENATADEFTFLTVARLVKQKNFPLMLRAFKTAWEQNAKVRLTIVGAGPEKETIENLLLAQYGATQPPVTLLDWSDNIPTLMRQADAYLLTSNYEGWARVLIEAMVVQLPTVTTDVGCAGEVLLDGVHGLVVPLEDTTLLADALLALSTDTALYRDIVHNLQSLQVDSLPGADHSHYGKKWVETLVG